MPCGELEAMSDEIARRVREAQALQREEAERARQEQKEAQRREAV